MNSKNRFLSYKEAQKIVQKAGIKTVTEYRNWKKNCPYNLPENPHITYANEWKSWSKFLGFYFLSYKEAQQIAKKAGIKSRQEYKNWEYRWADIKPNNIPLCPDRVYKNEWNGWGEFLGITVKR